MRLLYILLVLALVLNPAGCAILGCASKPAVSEQILQGTQDEAEQQEEKKVTAGTWFRMVGYLCLFGLFSPPPAIESEYITDISGEDKTFNPARKYRIDRKKDGGTK